MIVYSQNYIVFPPTQVTQLELNNPLIGWQNIVTGSLLTADTEQDGFPVANLATPMTYQKWRGEFSPMYQYITLLNGSGESLDYLAVAGHNFASGSFPTIVEGALALDSDGNPDWFDLTPEVIVTDDGPVLYRFTRALYIAIRLGIGVGTTDPFASVMYAGRLLVLPRRIYVGHAPMALNQKTELLTGFSETGEFLGRVTLRRSSPGTINMKNISPSFYRSDMRPWITAAQTLPFFFAWRPYSYSLEVAFCWGMNDGQVANEQPNGTMQFSIELQGLVQ